MNVRSTGNELLLYMNETMSDGRQMCVRMSLTHEFINSVLPKMYLSTAMLSPTIGNYTIMTLQHSLEMANTVIYVPSTINSVYRFVTFDNMFCQWVNRQQNLEVRARVSNVVGKMCKYLDEHMPVKRLGGV